MSSISVRITLSFSVLAGLILALLGFTVIDLQILGQSIRDGALVSSLVECVMEARRQEKNYFLYHNEYDLNMALQKIDGALALFNDQRKLFIHPCVGHDCSNLERELRDYHVLLANVLISAPERIDFAKIRQAGHQITELVRELSEYERASLAANVLYSEYWIIGAMLIVGIIGALVVRNIVRSVILPLHELENNLAPIAAGKFQQLPLPSRVHEVVSLTMAFNKMLSELEKRRWQLFHSEKLASLGILISGIAHELNNPLSNISTTCQLVLEELPHSDSDSIRTGLLQIDEQTERARRIVFALSDYARPRPILLQEITLSELLEKTLLLVRKQLGHQVTVNCDFPQGLTVRADRQRLQQVFINLLKNAVDAGGAQVTITLSGTICNKGKLLNGNYQIGDCTVLASRNYVLLSVADNGPGINAETLPHIFDPFFTTHAVGQGMGLGLYIVQEIIRELDGCITVESICGIGTRFEIALPGMENYD